MNMAVFILFSLSGRLPDSSELLQKEELIRLKRCIFSLQRNGLPPVTTHNVVDDWNDPVLNAVRRCNLFNTTHDRVKVCLSKFLQLLTKTKFFRLFSTLNF